MECLLGRDSATWWCCGKIIFFSYKATWILLPENFRNQDRDARNGASREKRCGSRVCMHFQHLSHCVNLGHLGSAFRDSRNPEQGTCIGGSQSFQIPAHFLGAPFCCHGGGRNSLLPMYNMEFLFGAIKYTIKWPLSSSELTFCDFYRTAICETRCHLDPPRGVSKIPVWVLAPHSCTARPWARHSISQHNHWNMGGGGEKNT